MSVKPIDKLLQGAAAFVADKPLWWDDPWASTNAPTADVISLEEARRMCATVLTQTSPRFCRDLPSLRLSACASDAAARDDQTHWASGQLRKRKHSEGTPVSECVGQRVTVTLEDGSRVVLAVVAVLADAA